MDIITYPLTNNSEPLFIIRGPGRQHCVRSLNRIQGYVENRRKGEFAAMYHTYKSLQLFAMIAFVGYLWHG